MPSSPANVPFVAEDIEEDYEGDMDRQASKDDQDLEIVVESDDNNGDNDDAIVLEESNDFVDQEAMDPEYAISKEEEYFAEYQDANEVGSEYVNSEDESNRRS